MHKTDNWKSADTLYREFKSCYQDKYLVLTEQEALDLGLNHSRVLLASKLFAAVASGRVENVKKTSILLGVKS